MVNPIGELFGKSPIRPIQEHMALACQCVARLKDFYSAVAANDWEQAASLQAEIKQLESEADLMKQELRSSMPRNLLLPFARADAIALLTMQDRIANKAKDIAGIMLGRKMEIPQTLTETFGHYLHLNFQAAEAALKAINELDELLETGFRGKEVSLVQSILESLADIERQSDASQVKIRADLMALEDSLPPVHVMFLYRVIEWTGDIADIAKRVGSRLNLLLSR